MKILFYSFIISIGLSCFGNLHAQSTVVAKVKEVTVFSRGAEVLNQVDVNLPKGNSVLYVQNVANDINLNTVRVAGPDGLAVLSVSKFLSTDVIIKDPLYIKLKDSLSLVKDRRELLLNKRKSAQGALKILDNEQLIAGTGKVDLADLTKLVDYYQVKSLELNNTLEAISKNILTEDAIVQRLQKEIMKYEGSGYVMAIQMSNDKIIKGALEISYITNAANWEAYYDLKSKSISSPLDIFYKAKVVQFTGVDWKNVKLSLSTGNPVQKSNVPLLNPSYIQFSNPQQILIRGATTINQSQNVIQSMDDMFAKKSELNEVVVTANGNKSPRDKQSIPPSILNVNQLNATFEIEIPYDIMSNGQPHSVVLKNFVQPAIYKYYAVPKIDRDAFLIAEITDFEKLNLVPGQANIIFENMFVGSSFINPEVTSDTLNLSMGRDKAITVKRERIMDAKSSQVSGSTKRQTYLYELRVRNGKVNAIDMLLKDQYPISTDKSIEVELVDNGGAAVNTETGVLTWRIDVKPGETKTYRFMFTVKSPKDRIISFY